LDAFTDKPDMAKWKPSRLIDWATILSVMAKCLETTEFETRIAEMEAAIVSRGNEPFKPKLVS
jgi:hypothetical protein